MTLTLTLRWKRRGREVCLEVKADLWKLGLLAALAYGLWHG
jgi:hypothetical protein